MDNLKTVDRFLSLLNMLERKHGIMQLDSHHRQFLEVIVKMNAASEVVTPVDLVDLNLTSRSSTYRKLADLRLLNLIKEDWVDGQCHLTAAAGTTDFVTSLNNGIQSLNFDEKTSY